MASSTIEQALYERLIGETDITDDLGNRIFLGRADPEAAYPYAVFFVVSDPHDAFAFGEVNTGQPRIQFNVYATDRYDALAIAQNVRERVRHFSGTWDGMTIHKCTAGGTRLFPETDRSDVFTATLDIMPQYVDAN